jgi:N-acetylmuramoyl-L-alanine amidase
MGLGLILVGLIPGQALAGPVYTSLSVDTDPSWDRVRIILDTKSSPTLKRVSNLSNPPRVVIELDGEIQSIARSEIDCEDVYLRSVRIESSGPNRVRLTAALAQASEGAKVDFYRNNTQRFLYIDINRPTRYQQPAWTPKELYLARAKGIPIVVIDPGHGGYDIGATARLNRSIHEKKIVLDVSKQVVRLLRAHGKVYPVMTRSGDYYPTLDERVELVGQTAANLLVSIHADSAQNNTTASGFAAWVLERSRNDVNAEARRILKYGWRAQLAKLPISKQNLVISRQATFVQAETDLAAETILASLDRTLSRHAPDYENRGIKQDNLKVLRQYYAPSVLIELGFLSNRSDSNRLTKKVFQDQLATGIAAGIEAYFTQRERGQGLSAPLTPAPRLTRAQELPLPPNFTQTSHLEASVPQEETSAPVEVKDLGDCFEYVVHRGDTLGKLARQFGVKEKDILVASRMPSRRKVLYPGDRLRIPKATIAGENEKSPQVATLQGSETTQTHQVVSGDSLIILALRYGTTIADLRECNGWSADRSLQVGEIIRIPATATKQATAHISKVNPETLDNLEKILTVDAVSMPKPSASSHLADDSTGKGGGEESPPQTYRVQPGDTLSSIAEKLGVEAARLKSLNRIKSDLIRVGQELKIPLQTGMVSGVGQTPPELSPLG